ncbi:MAG: response regulator [Thiotrichales bacterium]
MSTPKSTVLVADDSRVVRKAVTNILSEEFLILEAENGEQALTQLHANPQVGALLLDLWMPDMDGFEVLESLRDSDDERLRGLPVIIVTGHDDDAEIRVRAKQLGASDLIGKPFGAAELRTSVQRFVRDTTAVNVVPFRAVEVKPIDVSEKAAPIAIPAAIATKPPTAEALRFERRELLHREGARLVDASIQQRRPLTVLALQVDRVKGLLHKTDTEFTKRTLYRIYKLIEAESRRKDIVVRSGPTEFVVVMPGTDGNEAREVGKMIYRALRHTAFSYGALKFRLTLSGGLSAPKVSEGTSFQPLLRLAEQRRDRAAQAGGDQLVLDEPLTSVSHEPAPISLDEAASNLNSGHTALVRLQLERLMRKAFPLLVYANTTLKLDIDEAVKKIHQKFHTEHQSVN